MFCFFDLLHLAYYPNGIEKISKSYTPCQTENDVKDFGPYAPFENSTNHKGYNREGAGQGYSHQKHPVIHQSGKRIFKDQKQDQCGYCQNRRNDPGNNLLLGCFSFLFIAFAHFFLLSYWLKATKMPAIIPMAMASPVQKLSFLISLKIQSPIATGKIISPT